MTPDLGTPSLPRRSSPVVVILAVLCLAAFTAVAVLVWQRHSHDAEEQARKLISGVEFKPTAAETAAGADAVVLDTEWPEFRDVNLDALAASMRGRVLVDGRNFFDPAKVRAAGLAYEGVGRAARNGGG